MLKGGTKDQLILSDWKKQTYEEAYILGIHLEKKDVGLNGLSKNQFQLIHWCRSGWEGLGVEEIVMRPLR